MLKGWFFSNRDLKKLMPVLNKINDYKETMEGLSDSELSELTQLFRSRLAQGETLDDLLPEAYAAVREASRRVLGMFPYDVQILGAIVLHQGDIAEMKTGEGKTLTAVMPLYLNALTKKSTILATTNNYLALRDSEEMRPIFEFMGMTCRCAVPKESEEEWSVEYKRTIFASDVVYSTNTGLCFNYLSDNLSASKEDKFFPEPHYLIIDEADAVLLDNVQTPLIISGMPRIQSNYYAIAEEFVNTLERERDYKTDRDVTQVWLTYSGMEKLGHYFSEQPVYIEKNIELIRHVILALRARTLFKKDRDYVVVDNEIKLLTKEDGRVLDMTHLQGGQHQAIEAHEGVMLTKETRAVASITYQNFFRLFKKLAGMTGTGKTVESEFIEVYNMQVIQIPTHRPVIRVDYPDKIFRTLTEKVYVSMEYVKKIHATGQPILLVTESVSLSQLYSEMLLREKIPHNLLNAYNAAKEAEIIAEAGQWGAVTVATPMAGRGTDILLGEGVAELGGLAVIGTEKMSSKRVELQLRGRSGRQGDPGMSQFFVSLEDSLILNHEVPRLEKYKKDHQDKSQWGIPIKKRWVGRTMRRVQQQNEESLANRRRMILAFDDSVRLQREKVYEVRNQLINGEVDFSVDDIVLNYIDRMLVKKKHWTKGSIERFILDHLSYFEEGLPESLWNASEKQQLDYVRQLAKELLEKQKNKFKTEKDLETFYLLAVLKAIDASWTEEVDNLQQLRSVVMGRQSGNRNPLLEYHKEARSSYDQMRENVHKRIVDNILLSNINYTKEGRLEIFFA